MAHLCQLMKHPPYGNVLSAYFCWELVENNIGQLSHFRFLLHYLEDVFIYSSVSLQIQLILLQYGCSWAPAGRPMGGARGAAGWVPTREPHYRIHCMGKSARIFYRYLLYGTSQWVLGLSSGVGFASAFKLFPQGRWCMWNAQDLKLLNVIFLSWTEVCSDQLGGKQQWWISARSWHLPPSQPRSPESSKRRLYPHCFWDPPSSMRLSLALLETSTVQQKCGPRALQHCI